MKKETGLNMTANDPKLIRKNIIGGVVGNILEWWALRMGDALKLLNNSF